MKSWHTPVLACIVGWLFGIIGFLSSGIMFLLAAAQVGELHSERIYGDWGLQVAQFSAVGVVWGPIIGALFMSPLLWSPTAKRALLGASLVTSGFFILGVLLGISWQTAGSEFFIAILRATPEFIIVGILVFLVRQRFSSYHPITGFLLGTTASLLLDRAWLDVLWGIGPIVGAKGLINKVAWVAVIPALIVWGVLLVRELRQQKTFPSGKPHGTRPVEATGGVVEV